MKEKERRNNQGGGKSQRFPVGIRIKNLRDSTETEIDAALDLLRESAKTDPQLQAELERLERVARESGDPVKLIIARTGGFFDMHPYGNGCWVSSDGNGNGHHPKTEIEDLASIDQGITKFFKKRGITHDGWFAGIVPKKKRTKTQNK